MPEPRRLARVATIAVMFVSREAYSQQNEPSPEALPPPTGEPSELPPQPPAYPGTRATTGARPGSPDSSTAPVPHGAYVHDGLFARVSVGPGLFQASTGRDPDNRHYDGGTVAIDAALGGTAARGFVIGGAYQTNRVFSLSSTDAVLDGDEPNLSGVSFAVDSVSVFADYYPDPTGGLHFLGALGMAWLNISRPNNIDGPSPNGPVFSAGAGYEWFIGPALSLGFLARANLGLFSVKELGGASVGVTTFVPTILATATYH